MAWFQPFQDVRTDKSVLCLAERMQWSVMHAIGVAHTLRAWCLENCENGDLRGLSDFRIAHAGCVDPAYAKAFVDALVESEYAERLPYFRLKNWWSPNSRFLKHRHKDNPERWCAIENLYTSGAPKVLLGNTSGAPLVNGGNIKGGTSEEEKPLGKGGKKRNQELQFTVPLALNKPEFISVWSKWIEHRKQIRKPLTQLAADEQLRTLEADGLTGAIERINRTIANGWQGLWAQPSRTSGGSKVWELKTRHEHVQQQIQSHICNPENVRHDKHANQKLKDEYRSLKELARSLSSQIANYKEMP